MSKLAFICERISINFPNNLAKEWLERERQLNTIQDQAMRNLFPLLPLRKGGVNPRPINNLKKHPPLVFFGSLPSTVASQWCQWFRVALKFFSDDNCRPCFAKKLLASLKYCSTLTKLYGEGNYNLKKVMLLGNVLYMNNITTFPKQHKMTFPIEHYLLDASQPMFLDHFLSMQHVVQQDIV